MSVKLTYGSRSALCQYNFTGDNLVVESSTGKLSARISTDDILNIEERSTHLGPSTIVHFIRKLEEKKWTKTTINLCPGTDRHQYDSLTASMKESFQHVTAQRPKSLLVLINPVSGKGKSRKLYENTVAPLFKLAKVTTKVIKRSKHLTEVAESHDMSPYDGIVLLGGDGTYNEVVNALLRKTNQAAGVNINDSRTQMKPLDIPVCIIPTGTGNGAAEALFGTCDVTTITLHIIRGRQRHIPAMGVYCNNVLLSCSGCVQGMGFASDLFYLADKNLRCMGTARYSVAPLVYMFKPVRIFGMELTTFDMNENGDLVQKDHVTEPCCMMLNWAFNSVDSDQMTQKAFDTSVCCVRYSPISKMKMMKYLATKLMKKARDSFKQDFIEIYHGNVIDIRLTTIPESPPDCDVMNRVVSVDGEIYDDCSTPEYRLRMIDNLIKVFCSY